MRRTLILCLTVFTLLITSCNKNEEQIDEVVKLSGTHWVKTTDTSRHFTFTSDTEYVYVENSRNYPGTYTFNGETGKIKETSSGFETEFKVNGDILAVNQSTSNSDLEALYEKQ